MTVTDAPKLSIVPSREPVTEPAEPFKDAPVTRLEQIRYALACARTARNWLRRAGANNAAGYMARAIKSVEGAERHAVRLEEERG